MSIEAMKQALEALERVALQPHGPSVTNAITALRAAIEQGEKPVAWMHVQGNYKQPSLYQLNDFELDRKWSQYPLYTAPRQEQYDQTSLELCEECGWRALIPGDGCLVCARQKAKPAAWVYPEFWDHLKRVNCGTAYCSPDDGMQPLYTSPRQWVELTDDEARALVNRATFGDRTNGQALVYMVDAKLKEKNT